MLPNERKKLKRDAMDAIHDAKPSPVLIGLVYIVLILLLQGLSMSVSGELEAALGVYDTLLAGGVVTELPVVEVGPFANLLIIALDIMIIMLAVGFTIACLNASRRLPTSVGNLFDSFGRFLRSLGVYALRYVAMSLAAMLYALPVTWAVAIAGATGYILPLACLPLLLPSLVLAYAYRQAVYLMLDHPEWNSLQCLRASRALMKGHKWELFRLDLSLLGWYLLSIIPVAVVWTLPYTNVCYAGYYNALSGCAGEPVPQEPQEQEPPAEE